MLNRKKYLTVAITILTALSVLSACAGNTPAQSGSEGQSEFASSDGIASGDSQTGTDSTGSADSLDGSTEESSGTSTAGSTDSTGTSSYAGDSGNEGVSRDNTVDGNLNTSGFPIAKTQMSLRIMAEKTSMHSDFNTMDFFVKYEKMTNIKIVWDIYSTSERITKKTLAFASGNPPDVMCMLDAFSSADIVDLAAQSAILPIGDLLSKWAPNVKKALDTNASAKKSVTALDGKIYSVPYIVSVPGHDDFLSKVFINTTWLDNLGLQMPTTYDELLGVLRQFKNGDPNANGQPDEIPIAIPAFDPMFAGAPKGISWSCKNDRMYVDSTGTVNYFMASTAYRDSLKFFKTLYSENLADKNVFEGKTTVEARASTGRVGVFTTFAGILALPERELKNYEILPPIKATATSKPTVMSSPKLMPFAFVVTAAAKSGQKMEAALRWVDYFFTTDGFIVEQYGFPSGGYYKKLANGKLQILPGKTDTMRYKVAPGYVLPSWSTLACKDAWQVKAEADMTEADKFFKNVDEGQTNQYYRPLIQPYSIHTLYFAKTDSALLVSKMDGIHSAAYNDGLSFVRGDANIDTGWNEYIENLKRLGLENIVSIYQKSYTASK
ncbi:MAG: extracellular solute-binding protein [Saccharofermentanales bacterium]